MRFLSWTLCRHALERRSRKKKALMIITAGRPDCQLIINTMHTLWLASVPAACEQTVPEALTHFGLAVGAKVALNYRTEQVRQACGFFFCFFFLPRGTKLLGGRASGLTAQLFWASQIRRRARILEVWIHVGAKVCLPDLQSISWPGPGSPCLLFLCSLSVCFPLHWSDHLLVPLALKSCHNSGGAGKGGEGLEGRGRGGKHRCPAHP